MSGLSGVGGGGGNATYLRIGMGKDDKGRDCAIIGKRAKEGDPGAVPSLFKGEPVLDKDGKPVYRTEHGAVDGMVTSIERDQPEYNGKKVEVLNLLFATSQGDFRLQLTKGDDYWVDFAQRARGVDWSKPVKLTPRSIPQENNPKFSNRMLIPSQGGENVKRQFMLKWHKEGELPEQEPGMPPPYTYDAEEGEWKRKKVWNWLDQNVIQEAIDRVEFLNGGSAPADEADQATGIPASELEQAFGAVDNDPEAAPY